MTKARGPIGTRIYVYMYNCLRQSRKVSTARPRRHRKCQERSDFSHQQRSPLLLIRPVRYVFSLKCVLGRIYIFYFPTSFFNNTFEIERESSEFTTSAMTITLDLCTHYGEFLSFLYSSWCKRETIVFV